MMLMVENSSLIDLGVNQGAVLSVPPPTNLHLQLDSKEVLGFTNSQAEFSLLIVMSYDRYVAICKPLHYGTLLGSRILKLSCSDAYLREVWLSVVSVLVVFGCFVFIVLSYVQILRAVLRIPSEQGRHKAFATCLPHLAVVSLIISTGSFAYLKPPSISSPSLDLVLSVLYSVVPPAVNPLIYSMRNQELKNALWKLVTGQFLKQ
ncbi:olfactory receptor 14J1-like [Caloenas nicobarica]|uniref:olfactory receptor 14J1-like n=1 Tax=Caloenas nicobarica TaxID=187106 RepID=UPI0032B77464